MYLLERLQGHFCSPEFYFFFKNIYWLCVFNLARDCFPYFGDKRRYAFCSKVHSAVSLPLKNHFLSSTPCIFFKVSKFQNWPRPLFKTVSTQMDSFALKTTFSNFSAIKYSQFRWFNKKHFPSSTLCISAKVGKFQNWPRPFFKTVFAEMDHFASKTTFSNFSTLKYSQWK